ncbi:hypothetical protein IU443_13030 [Nocardia farcinica]|uniref:hypothetical protein n=1 Tax=Nocardia farcinica TaxID=37329 RepID=UPI0018958065|nr:hypothetical protein [Nocardia farcinica]MBF6188893.1 hypothetical protein [Nocardia farcinica]MBF6262479.1 hypothetical protein [Nocardia farcinica]MBF6284374.1 hypothetical protein [Nocardia farcinica]MBF6308874.1 hypothetical protein [Nocardia farcinica]MBF6390873.1 hypothetical protein [Nocardia farcinica]
MSHDVECSFLVRTRAVDHPGKFFYRLLSVDGWHGDGLVRTPHPPAVGDTLWLFDRQLGGGASYRIVARDWRFPAYGSASWLTGEPEPERGPLLRCLVEQSPGLIVDEAPHDDDMAGPPSTSI